MQDERENVSLAAEGLERSTPLLLVALATVYIIWGSTYLLIRFAVETIPPFLMSGTRVLVAGIALYAWARKRGAVRPSRSEWQAASISGVLIIGGGTGSVAWAEQTLPSGLAAMFVASVPLWTVLLGWLAFGSGRPGRQATLGLGLGFGGIALLVGPGSLGGASGERLDVLAAAVLLIGAAAWAAGSLIGSQASLPRSNLLTAGMQLLAGGVVTLLVGVLVSEPAHLDLSSISTRSLLSLVYLIVAGSIVAFSAYSWLLRNTTPDRATSYSYVNPVIAVFFGWAFGGETPGLRTLVAAAVIVAAVMLIVTRPPQRNSTPAGPERIRT